MNEMKAHSAVRRVLGFNDSMTREGAHAIKTTIVNYWRSRGHTVNAFATTQTYRTQHGTFTVQNVIRSDMRNGWPKGV